MSRSLALAAAVLTGAVSRMGCGGAVPRVEERALYLSVALAGRGVGRVTSVPAGIDCPQTCSASFPAGTHVELMATPETGSAFSGWAGACSGFGSCGASETAAVSASFATGDGLTITPSATQVSDIRLNRDPMRTFIRQWVKFEARGKDGAQPRVAWFVQEGEDGGTIAADGTYTPPAQPGLFHVTAVRVDDPTLAGSIPVQVVTAQELYDYGGPILPAPKVQLVWWGTTDDFQGAVDLFHGFLAGVNGSDWLAVLDQYLRGAKAQVSVAGEIFEPAQSGGTARAQSQLCAVLESHRMAPDPTTIYSLMVASSSGNFAHHATTVCQGVRVPIIVLSLPPQDAVAAGGCQGTMTPAEDMLRAFSHELAETMTDPTASMAWADIFGQEVADVCASPICAALPTGRFPLNALLSNSTHGCAP